MHLNNLPVQVNMYKQTARKTSAREMVFGVEKKNGGLHSYQARTGNLPAIQRARLNQLQ